MTQIGVGIHEAIDWMQDRLLTTRPLAERTLFSLIAKREVIETDDGYILSEAANPEDELEKTRKRSRGRRRRHVMRQQLQQFMKLDANQIADQIMSGGRERGARAKPSDDSNAVP